MLDTGQASTYFFWNKNIFTGHLLVLIDNGSPLAGISTHSSVFRLRSVSGDGIRGMTRCNIPSKYDAGEAAAP